ncbi:MAG: RecX family transcriptional regulator [Chloroflexi bacterium]|nr:RecX family transcriptional regulator [Chloroflexota bacterium]
MGRTITALEAQKRNKDRVNVYLDGEFAFGLALMEAAHLHKGQVLSDDDIADLRARDEVTRAVDRAINLLARRPYSTTEIRRNLIKHDIDNAVIDAALERLVNLGYVDDRAFAEFWVENRDRFRPRGPRALRYELRQKGVAPDIIDSVLQDLDAGDAAYRVAQGKLSRWRGLTEDDFRKKMMAFLGRRGFDYDVIRDVVERVMAELENEQPDYFALEHTEE